MRIVVFTKRLPTGNECIIGAAALDFGIAITPEQLKKLENKGISCTTILGINAIHNGKVNEIVDKLVENGHLGVVLEPNR
jgi:hypothetical protein